MDKLKQFLKWGLLSVILQCLVLFVFDKFYFKLNSDVNVKAIDIASQHTKENNDVKLPGNMMDKKISYDGEYIAYLNNNDELKVFNTLKDDESHVDIENEKASYYTWLRDRNRLIVITNIKYNNKKNTVNLYSIDVDTNKTKKIELGNMNSSYKVNEITVSTKTGVIYIEFKNEDTKESIVKRIDNNDDITDVRLVTDSPGNIEVMPRADRLVYDSEKESGIYLTQQSVNGSADISIKKSSTGEYFITDIELYKGFESTSDYEKLMKQVLEEYGIDTHVTVSMKGSIAGDMSQYDKSEVSGRMLKMLGAKTVTTGQIQDSYVVYAYAKSVKDSVSIGKNKINVNITMNYDETRGVTDIQLSTPIYNEDF